VLELGRYIPVYHTGTFFPNFIPALINIYNNHLAFSIFLTVYPCLDFKEYTGTSKFPEGRIILKWDLIKIKGQAFVDELSNY
jgi:hypothetical protein